MMYKEFDISRIEETEFVDYCKANSKSRCGNGICNANGTACICNPGYVWDLSNSINRNCYMRDNAFLIIFVLLIIYSIFVGVKGVIKLLEIMKSKPYNSSQQAGASSSSYNSQLYAFRAVLFNVIICLLTIGFFVSHYIETVLGPVSALFLFLLVIATCGEIYSLLVGLLAPIYYSLNASPIDFQKNMTILSILMIMPSFALLVAAQVCLFYSKLQSYSDLLTSFAIFICIWSVVVTNKLRKTSAVLISGLEKFKKHMNSTLGQSAASSNENDRSHISNQISYFIGRLIFLRRHTTVLAVSCITFAIMFIGVYAGLNRNFPYRFICFYFLVFMFPSSAHVGIIVITSTAETKQNNRGRDPGDNPGNTGTNPFDASIVPDSMGSNQTPSLLSSNKTSRNPKRSFFQSKPKSKPLPMMVPAASLNSHENAMNGHISIERRTISATDLTRDNAAGETTFDYMGNRNTMGDEEAFMSVSNAEPSTPNAVELQTSYNEPDVANTMAL